MLFEAPIVEVEHWIFTSRVEDEIDIMDSRYVWSDIAFTSSPLQMTASAVNLAITDYTSCEVVDTDFNATVSVHRSYASLEFLDTST